MMTTISPRQSIPAILVCLLQAGCGSLARRAEPSIAFTKVPAYGEGGPVKTDDIAGHVSGAQPGQGVVVYAKSGFWWVQPSVAQPLTPLRRNSTWAARTHPGSAYAALLVRAGYRPPGKMEVLPEKGGGVLAVAEVEGPKLRRPPGTSFLFSGYEWQVRHTPNNPGGTNNDYDPTNAVTDRNGFLHLRIAGSPGRWTSAEVTLPRSLGYGTYRFVVRDVSQLEPGAVFTMVILDDRGPASEMDVEISRWGDAAAKNGQFVIQPYYIAANTRRFQAPSGVATFMLRWEPGRAWFKVFRGRSERWESRAAEEHVFTAGVPTAGNDSVRMNLYVFHSEKYPLRQGTEVVVEKFDYLP